MANGFANSDDYECLLVTRHNSVFKDHFYHDLAILKLSVNKIGKLANQLKLRIDEVKSELAQVEQSTTEFEDKLIEAVDDTLKR